LLVQVFKKPDKIKVFVRQVINEMDSLGISSMGIVAIISLFMGAVLSIQTATNLETGLIPAYTIGFATRQAIILEFSPTIIALILAGKVGSNIASEIGTMRVTEQIDAFKIMGVNAPNYLILPKLVATLIMNPFIVIISMFLGIVGGWLAGDLTGLVSSSEFLYGVQKDFKPFSITYAMVKTLCNAFIITSVSAYFGFHTKGGALEVGKSSTKAVVYSSIIILLFNFLITQLLLI